MLWNVLPLYIFDPNLLLFLVTELETDYALNAKNADKTSFWFRKEFKDLENQPPSYTLSRYIGKQPRDKFMMFR